MNYSPPDKPDGPSSLWDVPHVQAQEFVLERRSNGILRAASSTGRWVSAPEALDVLAQFQTPQRPRAVAQRLTKGGTSALAWVSMMETLRGLMAAGVLVPEGAVRSVEQPVGFAMASQHISMLGDEPRTAAFLRAIRAAVTPQDVVVDIGTGTGVLALGAGRAGARQVYALEMSAMAAVASAGVAANHLEGRVVVIPDKSTEVTLPAPATVVVGEIIGDDLFDEQILPIFADAARRLAVPGAVFIPGALQPVLQPVHLPPDRLGRWVYLPDVCQDWTRRYGIDFRWLSEGNHQAALARHEVNPAKLATFLCGPNVVLPQVTFPNQSHTYSAEVDWPGFADANAFLLGFEADLGGGSSVSNLAGVASASSSWGTVMFVVAPKYGPDLAQPQRLRVEWTGGSTQVRVLDDRLGSL